MARTNLPTTALVPNNAVLNPASTALDAANGMNIQIVTNGVPAGGNLDDLILLVTNTTATSKAVTIRAGSNVNALNVPAFRAAIGDLVTQPLTATTGSAYLGPFDISRFQQPDGSLNIDFAAGMTGTVTALLKPKRF